MWFLAHRQGLVYGEGKIASPWSGKALDGVQITALVLCTHTAKILKVFVFRNHYYKSFRARTVESVRRNSDIPHHKAGDMANWVYEADCTFMKPRPSI